MKKLLLLLVMVPMPALAQYSVWSEPIINQLGQPIPGATVAVCTSLPSLVTPCGGSSLATIYSSFTGGPQINPIFTDSLGRALIFAPAGNYYVQIYGSGIAGGPQIATAIVPITVGGGGGGGGGGVPTGVGPGSILVSTTVGGPVIFQTKSFIDVRDIPGVDCTGNADSAPALNLLTGNSPTSDNLITGKTLSFGNCPNINLANTWLIKNQAGFTIDGFTRSGAASQGVKLNWTGGNTVQVEMEYVDGFLFQGFSFNGNTFATGAIVVDKTGAGGIWNTTDGRFVNNTFAGANQNWKGVSISPVSSVNVEDIRIENSTFYCNAPRATSASVGIQIGPSANAKNEIFTHNNITQCLYGIYAQNGSFQARDGEFTANGGSCVTGNGADIRIDTSSDVDIIEGNLDENSLQGINVNNDGTTQGPSNAVIVIGNHAAPAGCENTAHYWYNTGPSGASWIFDGDTWDADSNLVKVIGTSHGQQGAHIFTRALQLPNTLYSPWWMNGVTAISEDLQISNDNLMVYAAIAGGIPQAGSNYPSPFQVFRGYLNGSLTPDDFVHQFIPAGTAGSSGGTYLLKHQQGATGTEMFAFDGSYPGMTLAQIPTPAAPVITNSGAGGGITDAYSVVAYGASGNTVGSSTGSTATANATLTTSNFNVIAFDSVPGAVKYCIWRTAAGGTPSTLGNIGCMSALQINFRANPNVWGTAYTLNNAGLRNHYLFNDTGLAGDSASLPATNTTGNISQPSGTTDCWNGDACISRDSPGVLDIGNGTPGDKSGTINAAVANIGTGTGVVQLGVGTFSSLAACAGGTEGRLGAVSDSTTNTWGATVTAGGANHIMAYCDGTNWTVMGK